ncbi:MAG: 4-hydroxy-tetrahydrodipicolinate reductase, partial [Solirubrobacteraceae bacterium]
MGKTVCSAVQSADDMELVARADPALGASLTQALAEGPEVLVDFTVPESAAANAREAAAAGVHVVIGTTGFDLELI